MTNTPFERKPNANFPGYLLAKQRQNQRASAFPCELGGRLFSRNTVQVIITTVSIKRFFNGGTGRWCGPFFSHFFLFRLITRGLIRLRRGSVRSCCNSANRLAYHCSNGAGVRLSPSGSRARRMGKH